MIVSGSSSYGVISISTSLSISPNAFSISLFVYSGGITQYVSGIAGGYTGYCYSGYYYSGYYYSTGYYYSGCYYTGGYYTGGYSSFSNIASRTA